MIVTLLSDFGTADSYVGQMKGALLAAAPDARLVDLTHAVPPQDVRAGAFHLWAAVAAFPPGTVHLAVVDPGVGTARRAVAVGSRRGDVLVGPDNGLLAPALDRLGGVRWAVRLRPPRGRAVSATFHGRDLFGPAAGRLATGARPGSLGSALPGLEVPLAFPAPCADGARLEGEVLHADVYGNHVTNLPAARLPAAFEVRLAGRRIRGPAASYQAVPRGRPLALVGSSGLLELSVRDGSARRRLRARVGSPVVVVPAGDSPGARGRR